MSWIDFYRFHSYSERIGDLETEKGNLVEEVVSLQEKLSELRLEKESEIERVKKDLEGKGTNDRESAELRLKDFTWWVEAQ